LAAAVEAQFEFAQVDAEKVLEVHSLYQQRKKSANAMDFDDLLIYALKLLQENEQVRSYWQQRFRYVLVDEYQDTNTLQSALIDSLKPRSLFCVGDYDQSIYAFNGANIKNIGTFPERYPGASVFTLKTNYRSTAPILSLANRVIERNERIYPKTLEVGRVGKSHPPKLLVYRELFEQYQAISSSIKTTYVPNDQIAVIFRNNASADGIEGSLRELGIPCRRKGGTSFFEAKEVKFLLDLLVLLVNPKDMMAFIHVFDYAKGVGSALAKDFFHCLTHFGEGDLTRGVLSPSVFDLPRLNPNKNIQLGLFDDDLEIGSISRFAQLDIGEEIRAHPLLKHPRLSSEGLLFFREYSLFMRSVRQSKNPGTILQKAIESKLYQNIIERLSTQRAQLKSGEIDEEKKRLSQERIRRKARLLLDLSRPYKELRRFVNAMVLGGNELSEGEGVNLLTVHASKGLEFSEVYVVDLMDGRFPNRKLMSNGGSIEEERRLFYVAVTRAKDRLYLSLAKTDRIKKLDFIPSPFLYEAGLIKGEPKSL
jgi:DNA helicase-2/ATP-dependent DNA helicase PcrA